MSLPKKEALSTSNVESVSSEGTAMRSDTDEYESDDSNENSPNVSASKVIGKLM
jgi:hypothetical protein